jgi:hypothetical protein
VTAELRGLREDGTIGHIDAMKLSLERPRAKTL